MTHKLTNHFDEVCSDFSEFGFSTHFYQIEEDEGRLFHGMGARQVMLRGGIACLAKNQPGSNDAWQFISPMLNIIRPAPL